MTVVDSGNPPDPPLTPDPDDGGSLGALLAAARVGRRMSVEEVTAVTKIRGSLIRAVEADDVAVLGSRYYARAHIRSIARAVGVDPALVVRQFDRRYGDSPQTSDPLADISPLARKPDAATRPPVSLWAAAAGAVVFVLLGVLAGRWIANRHPGSSPRPAQRSASHSAIATPTGTVRDGGVMRVGQSRTFSSTSGLSVRYGVPVAGMVTLDGKPAAVPCRGTSVCTVRYSARGIASTG